MSLIQVSTFFAIAVPAFLMIRAAFEAQANRRKRALIYARLDSSK